MPTGQEYAQALRDLVEYTENISNEVVEDFDIEGDDGNNYNGYWCDHGGNSYRIIGTQEDEFFRVQYFYDLIGEFAERQAIEEAGDPDDVSDQDIDREAAIAILSDQAQENPEDYANLNSNLRQLIRNPSPTGYTIDANEYGVVRNFRVEHMIFIYEDGFTISDYHEAVQRVVSTGLPGRRFLRDSFGILDPLNVDDGSSDTSEDVEESEPPRYFS